MRLTADLTSTARRGTVLVLAGLTAAATLTGCSAGQHAQTMDKKPSVAGVNAELGEIALRDIQIVYPGREQRGYPEAGAAPLDVRIFNSGSESDALVEVTSKAAEKVWLVGDDGESSPICRAAEVSLPPAPKPPKSPDAEQPDGTAPEPDASEPASEPATGPDAEPDRSAGSTKFTVDLGPNTCALLAVDEPYHLELAGLRRELRPGDLVPVTFRFREAGEITLKVPFGLPTGGADNEPVHIHPEEHEPVDGSQE